jgi:hypothetical protein
VAPTAERVAAFLRATDRDAGEELGVLLPDRRSATVRTVAINGVMAGCRPEYMPVLIALVEAMADPRYGVEHSGNTPGAETLIVVNGPIIRRLGFNYHYLRNVAGFLPHRTDKGTFGNTWRVVLAENEDALARMGWTTIAQDQGLAPGESAVTISRFTGGTVLASVFGTRPEEMIPYLADGIARLVAWEVIFTVGMSVGAQRPLLVLSTILAQTLARAGLTKQDVQRRLFEHARIPASRFERYMSGWTNLLPGRPTLADLVRRGRAAPVFAESDDPERPVPVVARAEDIMIAVSGDPLRTNAYVFAHNGILGFPTTKPVRLPAR